MLVRVIGKLKNGWGLNLNIGKTNSSLNSHKTPPMRKNPNSLIIKSIRLGFFLPNFLFSNSTSPIELAVVLEKSDRKKPKRKCSSMSSSDTIGCNSQGIKESMNTTARSKKPTETSRLSNKAALAVFQILLHISNKTQLVTLYIKSFVMSRSIGRREEKLVCLSRFSFKLPIDWHKNNFPCINPSAFSKTKWEVRSTSHAVCILSMRHIHLARVSWNHV